MLKKKIKFLANFSKLLKITKTNYESTLHPYSTVSFVESIGYPIESHKVKTDDGYILTVHRIKHGKDGSLNRPGPPVLLQHGLWSSSFDWIIPEPPNSLGFLLADEGFDVWLANSRGNVYSREHERLSPVKESSAYWNFSWHEMGYYDLPAVIDYILSSVQKEQLFFIGHSQGTTIFFVMASTRKMYNEKIGAMVGLAPVAYLSSIKSTVLKKLANISDPLLSLSQLTGCYKILGEDWMANLVHSLSEKRPAAMEKLAASVLQNMSTYACESIRKNVLHIAITHLSTGASLKQLAHFAQACKNERSFRHFDYGKKENQSIYGQCDPPDYTLQNISVPVTLYYSDHDWIVQPKDVTDLYNSLPNKNGLHKVTVPYFNHLDFLWAPQSKKLIFDDIIKLFKNSQNYKLKDIVN